MGNYITPWNLTIISNNQANPGLESEHGFCILLEQRERRILFDCGEGKALYRNAAALRIDLTGLTDIVLSHGHYDHGGNLASLLETNPKALLWGHRGIVQRRWSIHEGRENCYVGLSEKTINAIDRLPVERIHWVDEFAEVSKSLWAFSSIPRNVEPFYGNGDFYLSPKQEKRDIVPDDLFLGIRRGNQVWMLCGCCHSGIENSWNHLKAKWPRAELHALLGGFHLVNSSSADLRKSLTWLKERDPHFILPGHCSGKEAVELWRGAMGAKVVSLQAGMRFEL